MGLRVTPPPENVAILQEKFIFMGLGWQIMCLRVAFYR